MLFVALRFCHPRAVQEGLAFSVGTAEATAETSCAPNSEVPVREGSSLLTGKQTADTSLTLTFARTCVSKLNQMPKCSAEYLF